MKGNRESGNDPENRYPIVTSIFAVGAEGDVAILKAINHTENDLIEGIKGDITLAKTEWEELRAIMAVSKTFDVVIELDNGERIDMVEGCYALDNEKKVRRDIIVPYKARRVSLISGSEDAEYSDKYK